MAVPKIIKGEDILLQFRVTDSKNNPYDLTGKTVEIKSKIGSSLVTFSSEVQILIALHGTLTLKLSDTVTETLTAGTSDRPKYFDVDIYITEGSDTRIIRVVNKIPVEDRQR